MKGVRESGGAERGRECLKENRRSAEQFPVEPGSFWPSDREAKGGDSFMALLSILSSIHQAFIEHLFRCQVLGTQR